MGIVNWGQFQERSHERSLTVLVIQSLETYGTQVPTVRYGRGTYQVGTHLENIWINEK